MSLVRRRKDAPCPACDIGHLIPENRRPILLGPHKSKCDHCGWEQTQILDNRRNIRDTAPYRRKSHGPRPS